MFEFIKSLFSRGSSHPAGEKHAPEPVLQSKPCKSCGRPVFYNPEWKSIPDYCSECKKDNKAGLITRTCKMCGTRFTLPESVQHWPDYCQECRAKYRPALMITRTCRGCGKQFTFPSSDLHWPHYCQECQAKKC